VTDYKKDLIEYRLDRARESLRDAEILFEHDGSPPAWLTEPIIRSFIRRWLC
jgi:hypothetical protein